MALPSDWRQHSLNDLFFYCQFSPKIKCKQQNGNQLLCSLISWVTNYSLLFCVKFQLLWQLSLHLSGKMLSRFKEVSDEGVEALKDATENLKTQNNTDNLVIVL